MNKYKNVGLWLSIASLILILLQTLGVNIAPEKYNIIVNAILSVLVGLGIISNPSSGRGYQDK